MSTPHPTAGAPETAPAELQRKRHLLFGLLVVALAATLAGGVSTTWLFGSPEGGWRYFTTAIVMSGLLLWLRFGSVHTVARATVVLAFLIIWGMGPVGHGHYAPSLTATGLVVLVAGFLWSHRAALVVAGLSLIALVLLFLGQQADLVGSEPAHPVRWLLAEVAVLIITTSLLVSSLASLRSARLRERQQSQRALHEAERRRAAESQLIRTQRLKGMGELASGVAHDFNNVLTILHANLASLSNLQGDAADAVEDAHEAVRQGVALTRRLASFAHQPTPHPEPTDINAVLEGLARLALPTLPEGVALDLDLAPELPPCVVDSAQLQHAVLNLMLNARDAMPQGGDLLLATRLGELEPGVPAIEIEVHDTRSGALSQDGATDGVSMALVRRFADDSDGQVFNRDSSFFLRLPVSIDDLADPVTLTQQSAVAADHRPAPTVLVVEDDEAVRRVSVKLLRKLGYNARTAGSVDEAMQLLDEGRPDLLFTDVVLNGDVAGPALAEEAVARWPELPVLFTSGYAPGAVPGLKRTARLLPKPFGAGDLSRAVGELVPPPESG